MKIYFLLSLAITTISLIAMEEGIYGYFLKEKKKTERIYTSFLSLEKEREDAWQWLKSQDIVATMNTLGPQLIASKLLKSKDIVDMRNILSDVGFELADTISAKLFLKENSNSRVAPIKHVSCSLGSIGDCMHEAYLIKKLFDKKQPDIIESEYGIARCAAFCIKLYKINRILNNNITSQRIKTQSLLTEFKKENDLTPDYITQIFENIFMKHTILIDSSRFLDENKLPPVKPIDPYYFKTNFGYNDYCDSDDE